MGELIMRRLYTYIAALAMITVGCTKEEGQSGNIDGIIGSQITADFTSSLEDEYRTRTTIGNEEDTRSVNWVEGDQISIISGDGSSVTADISVDGTISQVTLMQSSQYYAVYPADTDAEYGIEGVSFTIPTTQNGKFEDANFMMAAASDNDRDFKFLNMVSMLEIEVDSDKYDKVAIRSNDGSPIAGRQTVQMDQDGKIVSIASAEEDRSAEITLEINGEGPYYVAMLADASLPAGLGFRFFKDGEPVSGALSISAMSAARSSIRKLNPTANVVTDWYIAPEGDGNGLDETTPGGVRLLHSLLSANIADGVTNEGYTNAWRINGARIHLAEGTYTLKDFKIDFKEAASFSVTGPEGGSAVLTAEAGSIMTITSADCKASFNNIKFTGGKSAANGGAIYITNGEAHFDQCIFDGNSAELGAHISMNTSNPTVFINRSVFKNGTANTTDRSKWEGSAINSANTGATLCVNNCVFYNNTSPKIKTNDGLPCVRANGTNTLIMNSSFYHLGLRAVNPSNGKTDALILNSVAKSASETARGLGNAGTRKYNLTNAEESADDTNFGVNANLTITLDESTDMLSWTLDESITISKYAKATEIEDLVKSKFGAFDTWLKTVESSPYGIDYYGNTRNSDKMNPGAWDPGLK